jgi:predicted Zn-dependent protease
VLLRAALLVVALVACLWLGIGLRQVRLQAEADKRVPAASVDKALVREKRDLLDDARWLNPDTRADISEAQLLLFIHRDREAIRLLEDVVGREPENFEAWRGLAQATLRVDPQRSREAIRRSEELNTLSAPTR